MTRCELNIRDVVGNVIYERLVERYFCLSSRPFFWPGVVWWKRQVNSRIQTSNEQGWWEFGLSTSKAKRATLLYHWWHRRPDLLSKFWTRAWTHQPWSKNLREIRLGAGTVKAALPNHSWLTCEWYSYWCLNWTVRRVSPDSARRSINKLW
jgi:hypothetical protein